LINWVPTCFKTYTDPCLALLLRAFFTDKYYIPLLKWQFTLNKKVQQ